MKRKDFLQKFVLGLGGVAILSCDNDFFEDIPLKGSMEDFSIEDAKDWFNLKFANKNLRFNSKEKVFKRKPDFDKATKKVSKNNETTLIVPMDYEDQYRPSLIHYDEKTRWKRNLVKEYLHPIVEFLIISKEKGKFVYNLYLIAYDLYKLPKNTKSLKLAELNGLILITDYDDKIKNVEVYEKGKKTLIDNIQNNKKGKVSCEQWIEIQYYSYEGIDCGDGCGGVEITLHSEWQLINTCGSYGGNDEGYYDWGYDGGGGGSGSSGNGGSGESGVIPVDPPHINPINGCALASGNGNARNQVSEEVKNVLTATGLAADITGWSFDKAEAMARGLGASINDFAPTLQVLGKSVGIVSLVVDGAQFGIAITDGDWNSNDFLNGVQFGISGFGTAAAFGFVAAGPITLLVLGTVSVGLAIYGANCN